MTNKIHGPGSMIQAGAVAEARLPAERQHAVPHHRMSKSLTANSDMPKSAVPPSSGFFRLLPPSSAFFRLLPPSSAFFRVGGWEKFFAREETMAWESKSYERFADLEGCVEAQNGGFSGNGVFYAEMPGNEEAGNDNCGKWSACVRLCPRISRNIVFSKGRRTWGTGEAYCELHGGEWRNE
jgi:hypothetical protein